MTKLNMADICITGFITERGSTFPERRAPYKHPEIILFQEQQYQKLQLWSVLKSIIN
jgi:hypothetical protein